MNTKPIEARRELYVHMTTIHDIFLTRHEATTMTIEHLAALHERHHATVQRVKQ